MFSKESPPPNRPKTPDFGQPGHWFSDLEDTGTRFVLDSLRTLRNRRAGRLCGRIGEFVWGQGRWSHRRHRGDSERDQRRQFRRGRFAENPSILDPSYRYFDSGTGHLLPIYILMATCQKRVIAKSGKEHH